MSIAERTAALLDRLRGEDGEALGELFMLHRDRLWRMLYVRLDRRLASRVTPDDVIQETFLDVARRIGEYLDRAGGAVLRLAAVPGRPAHADDAARPPGSTNART